jgi:hypothetical protein
MKFIKIISLLYIAIFLNGCVQSAALLGPGITVVTTGNVLHAGFQYGANTAIKNETGKDTLGHMLDAVDSIEDSNEKKTIKDFKEWLENKILITSKKD